MRKSFHPFKGSLRQVLVLFLCTSLIFTLLLTVLSSSVYQEGMRSNTEQSIELYVSESEKQLRDELQSIKTALYTIVNKQELVDYMSGGRGYKAANVVYVNALLNDLHTYVPYIDDLFLAMPDGSIVAMTSYKGDVGNFILRYHLVERYFEEGESGMALYTLPVYAQSMEQYVLAMAVPVQFAPQTGILMAFCSVNSLMGRLTLFEKPFAIYCEGEPVYESKVGAPTREVAEDCMNRQAKGEYGDWVGLRVPASGWTVLTPAPLLLKEDALSEDLTRLSAVSLSIFALIECALVFAIYKVIISPIRDISAQSARIHSSSTAIDAPASGRNEIVALVNNINAMVARTNTLTEEVSDAKLRVMELDIANLRARNMFLQAQISPHFLYNMLECICGMAARAGNSDVRETTHLLAKLYQYCLKSPSATLGEELECVSLYEKIIRKRYGEAYLIEREVPEDLTLLPMPRMALEPLVENAVQHGFVRGGARRFFLRIRVSLCENILSIDIEDNGCGLDEARMRALNERFTQSSPGAGAQTGERIGLFNVDARLKLVYGGKSGLRLARNEPDGVIVHMKIEYPKMDDEEAKNP